MSTRRSLALALVVGICGSAVPSVHTALRVSALGANVDCACGPDFCLNDQRYPAYYKFNVSRAFNCCDQPRYDQRSDWDDSLQMNTGLVIACTKSGKAVSCR